MSWEIEELDPSAEDIYALLKRHRLIPESPYAAAGACRALEGGAHYRITSDGDHVGDLFVSGVIDGDTANIDLVPVPKYFRAGFDADFADATAPIFKALFSRHSIRRVTSIVPASRSRTKRALCSLGFKPEGRMREGVVLYKGEVEDLRILGLLEEYYDEAMERIEQWVS